MTDQQPQYQWTNKALVLVVGLVMTVVGALIVTKKGRVALIAGIVLIVCGLGAVYYSTTIKNWCAPVTSRFGGASWGSSFYTQPSFGHCWKLVTG